jgi:hypothetical protein
MLRVALQKECPLTAYSPKTLQLSRSPKYPRKSVPHEPRMDASKVIIHPLNTESAMKKVRQTSRLGRNYRLTTWHRSRRTTPSSSSSTSRPTSARSLPPSRSSTTLAASRSTPSSDRTAQRRPSLALLPMLMLSTLPPPSLPSFKRVVCAGMGIIGSCFARQCKSDVMHHGGVQGYQVRMTGMNQIHHMMPLLGSCSPFVVCEMPC